MIYSIPNSELRQSTAVMDSDLIFQSVDHGLRAIAKILESIAPPKATRLDLEDVFEGCKDVHEELRTRARAGAKRRDLGKLFSCCFGAFNVA